MKLVLITLIGLIFISCGDMNNENEKVNVEKKEFSIDANKTIEILRTEFGDSFNERHIRGIEQAADLWRESDGSQDDFNDFVTLNLIKTDAERLLTFNKISEYLESIFGNLNRITLDLKETLHLDKGEITSVDNLFGAYDISANLGEDFYKNKIAFFIVINYPFYNLDEKSILGPEWSPEEWAFARLGDVFSSRIPPEKLQMLSTSMTNADNYISEYNIIMGKLRDAGGNTYFPEDLKLITHWGLRDELKSHYGSEEGQQRQEMIYNVMLRIITQEIPEDIINSDEFSWDPEENKIYKDDKPVSEFTKEPDMRYQQILNNFAALKEIDKFSPDYPTYIERKFDKEMEIPQDKVEALFVEYISSPLVKQVAGIIKNRLGRDLRPYDIWYDGFKARSSISEEKLNSITRYKYPNPDAFKKELPVILTKLGWPQARAEFISSKVTVDPSRGAGHAWGSEMKESNSHLRSRIAENGMDYKGYNIAVHEFGHNVEQTITLHDVPYYMLKGVPNTAFTEAIAFVFQRRDLELMGMSEPDPKVEILNVLDNFWSTYEIMGVSVVDMRVWKWLYANPDADKTQLKEAVIEIAKEVWNDYYAPVFGEKDSPILAIYSHMIDYPLYLSAYPIGHLIEFQIENQIKGKNMAMELERMLKQGRLTPNIWLENAVGRELSIQPTLEKTAWAVENYKD